MNINSIAEFRIIKAQKIRGLVKAAIVEEKIVKSFFGLFKTIVYQDNFENYLRNNTTLIGTLQGQGFLYFKDLISFLKEYKSIIIYEHSINKKPFIAREENAMLINANNCLKLYESLKNIRIETNELLGFNQKIGIITDIKDDELVNDMIRKQKDEIAYFIKILHQLQTSDEFLYIRSEF